MAAMRILGEGQLSLTKFLLVTDARLPLGFPPLLTHILERADFSSDLFVFSPVSGYLDYTSNTINEGSKAVLMGLGDGRFTLQAELEPSLRINLPNPETVLAGSPRRGRARLARK